MPSVTNGADIFDAIYPDRVYAPKYNYWVVDTNDNPKSASSDTGSWAVTRWGNMQWGKGTPFDPTDIRFLGVFPDAVYTPAHYAPGQHACYMAGAFSIAEFTDPLKPIVQATLMLPVYPDQVRPSPPYARPHLMQSDFWRPITPSAVWTEPGIALVTSTWTEPGITAITSTWTEPAITPTVVQE